MLKVDVLLLVLHAYYVVGLNPNLAKLLDAQNHCSELFYFYLQQVLISSSLRISKAKVCFCKHTCKHTCVRDAWNVLDFRSQNTTVKGIKKIAIQNHKNRNIFSPLNPIYCSIQECKLKHLKQMGVQLPFEHVN